MANATSGTSSSTSVYSYSSNGLSGLVSGMDTESMVKAMLVGTQNKIDAQNQKIQVLEWKQSQYRDITTALLNFQNSFLSYTSSTNIRSASFFNQLTVSSTNSAVTVTNTSANAGTSFTIDSVSQLATATKLVGKKGISGDLSFTINNDKLADLGESDRKITIALDGVSKEFTLTGSTTDDIVANLNKDLQSKFGEGVEAKYDTDSGVLSFSTKDSTSKVTVTLNNDNLKSYFNATENTNSNKIQTGLTIAENFKDLTPTTIEVEKTDENGQTVKENVEGYSFKINGKEFTFSKDTSITAMMKEINSSDADVTMAYDTLNDRFTLTSKNTGAGINLDIEDVNGDLAKRLFGSSAEVTKVAGQNAKLVIDGTAVERNTNSFDVDGVLVTLNAKTDESAVVKADSNNTSIVDGIKSFVEAYNKIITDVTKKTTESADYSDYPALTDAQKEEMTDDQIEKWEKKAQTGLLRSDSLLTSMLSQLRSQLYKKADESGLALYDIGITTNTDGTLKIDEAKLNTMVETNLEGIKTLFTDSKNGLATRINSVVDSFAKTSASNPGLLVQKAGYENTTSDTQNSINKEIKSLKDYLKRLQDQYDSQKSRYWSQFTTLEKLISNGNSITSYFSSMNGGY